MDVKCFCTPLLNLPFRDASLTSSNVVCSQSPPDHFARFHKGYSCHPNQACMQCLSGRQDLSTNEGLYPCFIKQNSPAQVQRIQSTTCLGRCLHSHPWWSPAQIEERHVLDSCPALSRGPVQETTELAKSQPTDGNCTVYSLSNRCLDHIGHGFCPSSMPMHYAVYSSPVSKGYLANEGGHKFSNNVPPVLVVVYPNKPGSIPHVEQLAQIDRTPTPCIQDSYLTFSGY